MHSDKKIYSELRITNNAMVSFLNKHAKSDNLMCDFTVLHGKILKYLCDHAGEDIFQRDIEEMLAVKRSTATSILKCMERNGLITRSSVSSDARLKKLCLTERSISLHRHIEKEFMNMEQLTRNGISDEELECFFNVLNKIRSNFKD